MAASQIRSIDRTPKLCFILFVCFFLLVLVVGGASRADVLGQALIRASAWFFLLIYIFIGPRHVWKDAKWIARCVFAIIALLIIQLVPMPHQWWVLLPGRDLLSNSATLAEIGLPWRPLSVSPSGTLNALGSMVVPLLTLLLVASMGPAYHKKLVTILLAGCTFVSTVAILQFTGARFDNPFINDAIGDVSGTFANRNHFALFAAMGCLLSPVWAFATSQHRLGRVLAAFGLTLLFLIMILASGSRAGLILGAIATFIGLAVSYKDIVRQLYKLPKSMVIGTLVASLIALGGIIWTSVSLGRAVAINRAISMQSGDDLRVQALPTLFDMIVKYFPFGSGFGTFPLTYKIDEPDALLGPRYFNHAHNDLIEVIIDGGIFGAGMLLAAMCWWLWMTVRVWKGSPQASKTVARTGSGLLFLIFIASAVDYPARTPIIMVVAIIAAIWLSSSADRSARASET